MSFNMKWLVCVQLKYGHIDLWHQDEYIMTEYFGELSLQPCFKTHQRKPPCMDSFPVGKDTIIHLEVRKIFLKCFKWLRFAWACKCGLVIILKGVERSGNALTFDGFSLSPPLSLSVSHHCFQFGLCQIRLKELRQLCSSDCRSGSASSRLKCESEKHSKISSHSCWHTQNVQHLSYRR